MSTPESPRDYKSTVNLPVTDFPMRGNLAQTEPALIERWKKNDTYNKIIAQNKTTGRTFTMPDGPPYANGNIHIGHVLNKVLKDIVIKYKNLQGFQSEFIPGWDCHGLPIELKVTSALGSKKADMTKKEIRDLCRKEAKKWIDTQEAQFQRLGIFADWANPYYTMQPQYEAEEVRVLSKINENGIFYRGEKPVFWDIALQTALAAAEVEYQDHKSPSIYVKFQVENPSGVLAGIKNVSFVIWTTTPWTLPANYAISLNPNFEYGVYKVNDVKGSSLAESLTANALTAQNIIIAVDLKEAFEKDTGIALEGPSKQFKGSEAEGLLAKHPFMPRTSQLIVGDHVTLDAGTGAVHTAPAHGMDDYIVGLKYKLPVHSAVNAYGKFNEEVPQYQGMKIWDANKKIVEDLTASGHLLGYREITHSYPHSPRSKAPLIFRATPQWFIRMDGTAADGSKIELRKKALETVEKNIQFVPDWGRPRLNAMVSNTPDWCLSRQRTWGVPVPVLFCADLECNEALVDSAVMNRIADKMESTGQGLEAYYDTPANEFAAGAKCKKCGKAEFKLCEDILDVWFDSGVCHSAVQKKRGSLQFPADIYLEGSDQHRGWFQTSLMSAVAAYGEAPFKALITHGFVNDAQGHKMSKSKGNVIDPAEITKKYGAEILRLWVTYEDYGQDVGVSDEMFQRVTETYRRIRNTMRYLLGNLNDFNPQNNMVDFGKMPELDKWAMVKLDNLIKECTTAYDNYDFFKVYHALNVFFTVELSARYLDVLKDRMYTAKKDGLRRRSSQTVFYKMLVTLTGLMAPILTFLSEEVNDFLPGEKSESVFLRGFPKSFLSAGEISASAPLLTKMEELFKVRSDVAKHLEDLRRDKVIGSSLDAQVEVKAGGETYAALKGFEKDLREFLIVSQVTLTEDKNLKGEVAVVAKAAAGEKCPRCWHYDTALGTSQEFPEVCPKCVEALS